ncbi:bublin coiled-coil protein [Venturia canescens]|uniref:bublin coiled-coil protein n=1 Tax=Venturia canescens TaxID=32260 RepID=UPI001C9C316C|nr:bublin coiled-coil protein-like [Venturia canescens]
MADEKMVQKAVHPNGNDQEVEENSVEMDEEVEECNEQEFEALNAQLDQLNSALDFLESKNANVHAELVELLKSNRETRKQIQESQKEESAENSK